MNILEMHALPHARTHPPTRKVFQGRTALLREKVADVKLHQYNQTYLYPKLAVKMMARYVLQNETCWTFYLLPKIYIKMRSNL